MSRFITLLTFIALITLQSVLCHFELNYPATRGFNEDTEATAPCGNFNTIGARSAFPINDGFVEIYSGHTSYSYSINVIVGDNLQTTDYTPANTVEVASGNRAYPQKACLSLDLSKNSKVKNGVNGTIQIVYNGGDGLLYQCTDVTFEDSPANWNSSACVNADGSSPKSSAPAAATTTVVANKANSLTITGGLMLFAAVFVSAIII